MKQRLLSLLLAIFCTATVVQADFWIDGTKLSVGDYMTREGGFYPLADGFIEYVDDTHVTFTNVWLESGSASSQYLVSTDMSNMTITLVGTNKIVAKGDKSGLFSSGARIVFQGSGTLEIEAAADGIVSGARGQTITISDAHIKTKGAGYGIYGKSTNIFMSGGAVLEACGETSSMMSIRSLSSDYSIISPSNARFDTDQHTVVYSDGDPIVGQWVTICKAVEINEANFPDVNFRSWLRKQDYGKDSYLTDEEIAGVTKIFFVNIGVADLTGIEHFTALEELTCFQNQLKKLDVSMLANLKTLSCSNNQLTELLLPKSDRLEDLDCRANMLTALDVSHNPALTSLSCSNNQLIELDVSQNLALASLRCNDNQLTTLDVSEHTALEVLHCNGNQLTALNVSHTALKTLYCYTNLLRGNGMTALVNSLPETEGGEMRVIYGSDDNTINTVQVGVARGKGWKVMRYDGWIKDYVSYDGISATSIDETHFPNEAFRNWLLEQEYGLDGYLDSYEIENTTEMVCADLGIARLTGIEYFTALKLLDCSGNQLEQIDIRKNTALETLHCQDNQLHVLELSQCAQLKELNCSNNLLSSLDTYYNYKLTYLDCSHNKIGALDTRYNSVLTKFYCHNNRLNGSGMMSLVNGLRDTETGILYVYANDDTEVNVITSAQVEKAVGKGWKVMMLDEDGNWVPCVGRDPGIPIDEATFPDRNFRNWLLKQPTFNDGYIDDNKIADTSWIDVSNANIADLTGIELFTQLKQLNCSQNQLVTLDLSLFSLLEKLNCANNRLTALDVSHNERIVKVECYQNAIRGEAMTALISDLPENSDGELYVYDNEAATGNMITEQQVKTATEEKLWKVFKRRNGSTLWEFFEGVKPGDVNGDFIVDSRDADNIVRHINGDTPRDFVAEVADVNGDGKVDWKDADLVCEMAGVPTGIAQTEDGANELRSNGTAYDLQGRGVKSSIQKKGVYIQNSRKRVVK